MRKYLLPILLALLLPFLAVSQTNNFNILDTNSATISGGTINGATIGATTPARATFTAITSGLITGTAGMVISGGSIRATNYDFVAGTGLGLTFVNDGNLGIVFDSSGNLHAKTGFYPATPAAASQSATSIYGGTGAPSDANGSNGDIYIRSDGGALTTIYQKRTGAWTGIL